MSVEFLDDSQPWPIWLPEEPPLNRPLEARDKADAPVRRWRYNHNWETWKAEGKTWGNSWTEIVNQAMRHDWTLHSLPEAKEPTSWHPMSESKWGAR